jgi:transcriptional regulator with XRE-family HTH domain
VKRFRNTKATKEIGTRIKDIRNQAGFSLDDVADMTGFTQSLLSAIENGAETGISHLIEIAKAIGVHPKDLLDIQIDIKPRFTLSPKRKERNRLTYSITKLCDETDFFETARFTRDVVEHLRIESKIKANAVSVAVILKRLTDSGILKFNTIGRQKQYFKKKK